MAIAENIQIFFSNPYVRFGSIIIVTIIVAYLIRLIAKVLTDRVIIKTKTNLDDVLFEIIKRPLYVFVLVYGLYLAIHELPLADEYIIFVNKISFAISLLLATFVLSRTLALLIALWLKVHKRYDKTPKLITKIITALIYLVALLIILEHFDVEITPIIATLGVGGLAVGLALQNTLSNLFAGVHLISDKPINLGDFIELNNGEIAGYIEDIGWRSTRIRTILNTVVVVPNSKLAESTIVNDSMPEQELSVYVEVGVAYESDLEHVETVTIEIAKEVQEQIPGAVTTFEPFVRYYKFGDSNINFRVVLRVEEFIDKFRVVHEFIKRLKARYNKEDIEISWPIQKLYFPDGGPKGKPA
jgi:small-conductance mechanosensitive channel